MEPWLTKLNQGDAQAAWDLFAERYRPLMIATIRRLIADRDDVMEVFAMVCQELSANEFARLRRHSEAASRPARLSTWLVAVVRNLTVDWLRARDGRQRLTPPAGLSPIQEQIYRLICIEGRSYIEAYELLRDQLSGATGFPAFLREVGATHRIAPCPGSARRPREVTDAAAANTAIAPVDRAEAAELADRVRAALATEPADVRLAVELTVVERLPAADVARIVGWPNAKAVYNRVYRALAALRAELDRQGIRRGDL